MYIQYIEGWLNVTHTLLRTNYHSLENFHADLKKDLKHSKEIICENNQKIFLMTKYAYYTFNYLYNLPVNSWEAHSYKYDCGIKLFYHYCYCTILELENIHQL